MKKITLNMHEIELSKINIAMTLTTEQKREAYEFAIALINNSGGEQGFVCFNLSYFLEARFGIETRTTSEVLEYFQEFKAQKPAHITALEVSWFDPRNVLENQIARINALERALNLLDNGTN